MIPKIDPQTPPTGWTIWIEVFFVVIADSTSIIYPGNPKKAILSFSKNHPPRLFAYEHAFWEWGQGEMKRGIFFPYSIIFFEKLTDTSFEIFTPYGPSPHSHMVFPPFL
jgi:hypothetical protein